MSTRFSQSLEVSRLTRDGSAGTVSRDQILRRERGQGTVHFPCSADHVQDGQPYMVDPYSCYMNVGEKPTVGYTVHYIYRHRCFSHFSVLVAKPKKLLYTVANPAPRGLLNKCIQYSVYMIPVAYSFLYVPGMYIWSTLSTEYDTHRRVV